MNEKDNVGTTYNRTLFGLKTASVLRPGMCYNAGGTRARDARRSEPATEHWPQDPTGGGIRSSQTHGHRAEAAAGPGGRGGGAAGPRV